MEPREDNRDDVGATPGPFQYTLGTLMAATALFCVALALLVSSPGWVRVLTALCLSTMLPGLLTAGLIYGRGYTRAFCIGALFPSGVAFVACGLVLAFGFWGLVVDGWPNADEFDEAGYAPGILTAITWGLSAVVGVLAVGVRWKIEARRRQQQRRASPREETSQGPSLER